MHASHFIYIISGSHNISAMYYLPFYKWESSNTEHIKITWLRSNHWPLTQTGFDHYNPTHFTLHQHFSAVAHSLEKDIFPGTLLPITGLKFADDKNWSRFQFYSYLPCLLFDVLFWIRERERESYSYWARNSGTHSLSHSL